MIEWPVLLLTLFALATAIILDHKANVYDHKGIEFKPINAVQVLRLQTLLQDHNDHIVLRSSSLPRQTWLLAVRPQRMTLLLRQMAGVPRRQVAMNLQAMMEADTQQNVAPEQVNGSQYLTVDSMNNYMLHLTKICPKLSRRVIGKSCENRTIYAMRYQETANASQPSIVLESGIHAREWMSGATGVYFVQQLCFSKDETLRQIAAKFNFEIVYMLNPDGYAHTKYERYWRKNRCPQYTFLENWMRLLSNDLPAQCIGVDLNRNFNSAWNTVGTSSSRCNEIYAGTRAASEPETQAMSEYVVKITNLVMYVAMHCFSQMIMYPYGNTTEPAPNQQRLDEVAKAFQDEVAKVRGTKYYRGQSSTLLYGTSGTSPDYVASLTNNQVLSYTIELPPSNATTTNAGFVQPANEIPIIAGETTSGIFAMIKYADEHNYFQPFNPGT